MQLCVFRSGLPYSHGVALTFGPVVLAHSAPAFLSDVLAVYAGASLERSPSPVAQFANVALDIGQSSVLIVEAVFSDSHFS